MCYQNVLACIISCNAIVCKHSHAKRRQVSVEIMMMMLVMMMMMMMMKFQMPRRFALMTECMLSMSESLQFTPAIPTTYPFAS